MDVFHRSLGKSLYHLEKAKSFLPLGVGDSYRYWGENNTIYIDRGKGAYVWDLDKNAYVDFRMAYGPIILGYCDAEVDAAAKSAIDKGVLFGLATEPELAVAELICSMVPSVEKIRFANSGSEAVMAALRLARGATGKDSYVIVEGSFHGLFDAAMWRSDVESWKPQQQEHPEIIPFGKGIPELVRKLLYTVPLNDADALEDVFKQYADRIGALLIEPIMGNCCSISASSAYLRNVRELCTKYGVLLIIDEVKTGFRVARGGVQELYGVDADITTFAKAMANGYPIAAFGGRAELMDNITTDGGVVHGGTYCGHRVALEAARATLQRIADTDVLADIATTGLALQKAFSECLTASGVDHCFTGHPSMFGLMLTDNEPTNYREWRSTDFVHYDELANQMINHGLLVEPDSREPLFLCQAHSEIPMGEIVEKFDAALRIVF